MFASGHNSQSLVGRLVLQVFSLYTARHQVALCHYDIKLLNFLVQNVRVSALDDDCEDAEPDASPNNQGLGLSYALGSETTFKLGTLPTQWSREPASCRVVKLADFGTSYFDGATANDDSDDADRKVIANGAPVDDPRFFTTLENTPIDYLILGACVCIDCCVTVHLALSVVDSHSRQCVWLCRH